MSATVLACRLCGGPGEKLSPRSDLVYCAGCLPGGPSLCTLCGGEGGIDGETCRACVFGVVDGIVKALRDGRRVVRSGEQVKVLPSAPRKRDGFVATFRHATVTDGVVTEVEVYGGRGGRAGIRTFRPERVRWMRQPEREVA